jgi:isopentenyldiphosphate isomerase
MEDEYLDILDESGEFTGRTCLKSVAHKIGYFHPTIHVWFYTTRAEVLLQKRGSEKLTFPNYWDVSVAGHVGAGEAIEEAAVREVLEEIGLQITRNELVKIDVRKNINIHPNGIRDCEFQSVFLAELKVPLDQLSQQEEEVDGLCLLTIEEFKYHLENEETGLSIVPTDPKNYYFVMEHILKTL